MSYIVMMNIFCVESFSLYFGISLVYIIMVKWETFYMTYETYYQIAFQKC